MQQTPLFSQYAEHHGRVVDFHGWALPLQFSGIMEEHRQVREAAGIFDCSHMGEFLIRGRDSFAALDRLVIGDLSSLAVNKCRYTTLLHEDGGILDDGVALRLSEEELLLVTNAGALDTVDALLGAQVPSVENLSATLAKIDIQGPLVPRILLEFGFECVRHLGFWVGMRHEWKGLELIVARAGYTGEWGYELFVPAEGAVALWQMLAAHPSVKPCGLGARDTLRMEMGYPLSGQDLTADRTALEAGLDRFIAWDTDFPGKARMEQQRDSQDYQKLVLLRSADKRAPRNGFVLKHEGEEVGVVTSGTFGPTVAYGIGLGYVPCSLATPGVAFEAGPRNMTVQIETAPFYKESTGRKKIEAQQL
jgi:aminomethyltransferase